MEKFYDSPPELYAGVTPACQRILTSLSKRFKDKHLGGQAGEVSHSKKGRAAVER